MTVNKSVSKAVLIQAQDLGFSLGSKHLFEQLNLSIGRGDRVGLVGHNGAGKTSLLKLLSGAVTPDRGEIMRRRDLRLGVVEQFVPRDLHEVSLRQCVLNVLPEDERFDYRAETILDALGFDNHQMDQPIQTLSGGQQNLCLLARAQIQEPDLLLMDEPGNHMDVVAQGALRAYLNGPERLTFMMISHDRDLLDDCCDRTVFLRDKTTYAFDLNYSDAKAALAEQDLQAQHRLQAEEKEIERIRKSAKRLAQWGKVYDNEDLARKAKTMALRAEKLEENKTFVSSGSGLELSLASTAMRSKTVFTLEDFQVTSLDGERRLLTCEFLVAQPGDRIALLGDNGVGKSTTIKRLLQAYEQTERSVRFNPNVEIGYFDQELDQFSNRVGRYDWLARRVDSSEREIQQTLLHAGVAYNDFSQSVVSLSGGEKARMMFMALRLRKPNLMILDEPTNHIDLESREELEEGLKASGATLLITSHDRRFLEAVCNRFWLIEAGQLFEIDDLDRYYQHLSGWGDSNQDKTQLLGSAQARSDPSETGAMLDAEAALEDEVLGRIDELERLLREDQARKPKFQKPERQKQWQHELQELWAKLG